MGTILVCNHKGGVGKTSLAIHLAAYWLGRKHRVCAVDTDPQGSLTQWHSRSRLRGFAVPEVHFMKASELIRRYEELEGSFNTIIIDTPPAFSLAIEGLAGDVGRVLVPVTPGGFELDSLRTTLGMVPRERTRFVLNRSTSGRACREVERHLEELGPVSRVRNYAAFQEASLAGGSVLEREAESNAARDIRRLAREVWS